MEKIPLFTLWMDFMNWLFDHTEKFPKSVRFSVSTRLENVGLDILRDIIQSAYKKGNKKREGIERMSDNLNYFRILLRFAMQRKYLQKNSYEYAVIKIDTAGKMIGGWLKASNETMEESLFETL